MSTHLALQSTPTYVEGTHAHPMHLPPRHSNHYHLCCYEYLAQLLAPADGNLLVMGTHCQIDPLLLWNYPETQSYYVIHKQQGKPECLPSQYDETILQHQLVQIPSQVA